MSKHRRAILSRLVLTLTISTAIGFGSCANLLGNEDPEDNKTFEAPVFLKNGDEPLNKDGNMAYPSPAIFDIDNDGANELVVGTIFGAVYKCENKNTDSGDPVWSTPKMVKDAEGDDIAMENW